MSEKWEEIGDEILTIVKEEAGDLWQEQDTTFVKDRGDEVGKLLIALGKATLAGDEAEIDSAKQEIRVEKASIALRIDRVQLRAGDAVKRILKAVFGTILAVLESRIPGLAGLL